jgi:hypothetical protein
VGALAGRLNPTEGGKRAAAAADRALEAIVKTKEQGSSELRLRRDAPEFIKAPSREFGKIRTMDVLTLQTETARRLAGRLGRAAVVALLKQPTCVGETRAVLLHRMEQLTGQKFASVWEMVDWLEKNDPSIDLRSPPRPPVR